MKKRTKIIENLLFWSKELDKLENDFKRKMYNSHLVKLNLLKLEDISADEMLANEIIKYIGFKRNLPKNYYITDRKFRNSALGRQIAMVLIRNNTFLSLPEISKMFNKDHATVIHALKVIDNLLDTDKKLKKEFEMYLKEKKLKHLRYN